jgi:aspartate-semialdehyde dehydrogenase
MSECKQKNITLLGNCQTKALSWYIQQLDPSFDVKWISIESFLSNWGPDSMFLGKPINVITDTQEAANRLQSSDYLIFQHVLSESSENYSSEKIKMHAKNAKLISISSFFYDPDIQDPKESGLMGMIERANRFNVDIPAHKMIEKHGPKIEIVRKNKLPTHPTVFYFLELVREICAKTGWDYYSDEQYNQYLKEGYPFG